MANIFQKMGSAFGQYGMDNRMPTDQFLNLPKGDRRQMQVEGLQKFSEAMNLIGAQQSGNAQKVALAQNTIRQRQLDEEDAKSKAEQKARMAQYKTNNPGMVGMLEALEAGVPSALLSNKGSSPSSIKEFEYSLTNPDYAKFMEDRKSDTNINTGISGFQKAAVDSYNNVQAAANDARVINTSLDTLENLLDKGVNTGFGSGFGLSLQRIGQTIIGEDYEVPEIAGREAFQAETTKLILPLVKQLGVNPTDKDLDFVKTGAVELSKSEAGNKIMIAGLRLSQQRKLDEANFDNQFYLKNPQALPFERNIAFQKHMDENPELYTSITLQQAYDNLLFNQATNNQIISTNEEKPF